jgi:tetratricopeptide (TPR) repeat protein
MSNVVKEKEAKAEADQNVCSQEKMSNVEKTERAELHDDTLFSQPDSCCHGECPICFLPLPIDPRKSLLKSCCSAVICYGCVFANMISNRDDEEKAFRCPFCREPANDDENEKRKMKRIKANDPATLFQTGIKYHNEGDYDSAFEYLTKAADLGYLMADYELGNMYEEGEGVEKDQEKAIHHYEKAAIGGHPYARYNLACIEHENGNTERAVKHYIIAANLGYDLSMKALWKHYSAGNITKEDLDATLRTHQAAIDEMKSPEREASYPFLELEL